MIIEMRFISDYASGFASVWSVMEYDPIGNTTFEMLRASGEIFEDLTGQWWHIGCDFFVTAERATDYAGYNSIGDYVSVTVVNLSAQ